MCESCENSFGRRDFLKGSTLALGTAGITLGAQSLWNVLQAVATESLAAPKKNKAKVTVTFMYPPAQIVEDGKLEDSWAPNHWFTYPGNQYEPEKNHQLFKKKIEEFGQQLGIELEFAAPVYTRAAVAATIEHIKNAAPDAILIVNFWNTFAAWSYEITQQAGVPAIVYQPVGSNHQLPPKSLMTAERVHYIHSVENWDELENGLRVVRTHKSMQQSRLIRVADFAEPHVRMNLGNARSLGVEVMGIPAKEYNDLFDSIKPDDFLVEKMKAFKSKAMQVIDVEDRFILDGFRAHLAVLELKKRYNADAVTIKCLMLAERKPCVGFSLCNSNLIPCACEDQPDSALSLLLGNLLLDRGGFLHNPDFDINRNQYYGSHCTCALELDGPGKGELPFLIRPFTHQRPKTAALDVQFPEGKDVFVTKYVSAKNEIATYTGKILGSPAINTAGGCATRFLMQVDRLEDVCTMYSGPHPILFFGDKNDAMRFKVFAKLYGVDWVGNV